MKPIQANEYLNLMHNEHAGADAAASAEKQRYDAQLRPDGNRAFSDSNPAYPKKGRL